MPTYVSEPAERGERRQWAVVTFFVLLALVAINVPAGPQQQVASLLRSTVLRPFVWTQESLAAARLHATESSQLRAVLDSMVAASTARTNLDEENRQLRGLLSLSRRVGPSWVAASVIRAGTVGSESMFQLDVGTADGVEVNSPVITRTGLVGLVREVWEEAALGMDWTNPEFRASAMSADGLTYGLVEAERGEFRELDRLQFNGTAFHTDLPDGTVVLTSGLGSLFPRGIPLGRVNGLAEEDEGWRKSYWLEPMVQPGSVTHVLVATEFRGLSDDLSAAWPTDSILTDREILDLQGRRLDSLDILRDSIARLLPRIPTAPGPATARPDSSVSVGGGGRP